MTTSRTHPAVVVRTRLRPPAPHPADVPRTRLLARLDAAAEPVVLVAAPRGAGKTVLLAQWVAGRRCAWVSLSRHDDTPAGVWSAVLEALRPLHSEVPAPPAVLLDDEPTLVTVVLPELLNALASAGPLVLVLDGLDVVEHPVTRAALDEFVRRVPETVRVAMATARPPSGPVASLRAAGRLAEFTEDDLRFDLAETRHLLSAAAGRPVAEAEAEAVWRGYAGWATGLRLAGMALRSGTSPPCPVPSVEEFFRAEVLERVTSRQRRLLLYSSVLAELTPDRCAEVTALPAAGETLAAVASSSLLLRRTGSGLRCHPVLRAVLKSVLREEYPEVVEVLHARAAERLRREGDLDAAYEHARLAGLPGVAVRTAIETWPSAHPRALLARLDEVPAEGRAVAAAAELACGRPGRAAARLGGDLVAAQGVAARAGSHPASAGTWLAPHDGDLAAAQGVAALAGRDPASAGTWLAPHDGELAAAQGVAARADRHPASARPWLAPHDGDLAAAQQPAARPAEADDPPALAVRAWLALHNGDLPTAHHIATQAIAAPRESTRPWWLLLAQAALGTAGLWEGKPVLDQLDETAREAEKCGYRDAAVRALDARTAGSLLTGDVTAAQTSAAQAVAWHDLDPTRCAAPVVATAFLASRRGSRYPATALASATPHAEAFAALIHAQSTSDTQQRRKAHAQARAALTGLRHGPVLADLLQGCGVPDFRPAVLSDRERAVLRALAGPLTLREIAAELHVSHNTVKTHVRSVFRKLGAHDRADAVSRGAAATRPW